MRGNQKEVGCRVAPPHVKRITGVLMHFLTNVKRGQGGKGGELNERRVGKEERVRK